MMAATIVLAFLLGALVGAWAAWARFLRHERPKVEFKLTEEVLGTMTDMMVMEWLSQRGLTWMPKGVEFGPKVKR